MSRRTTWRESWPRRGELQHFHARRAGFNLRVLSLRAGGCRALVISHDGLRESSINVAKSDIAAIADLKLWCERLADSLAQDAKEAPAR